VLIIHELPKSREVGISETENLPEISVRENPAFQDSRLFAAVRVYALAVGE
jgi:hypothetical protein